jgi:hypothetical protein
MTRYTFRALLPLLLLATACPRNQSLVSVNYSQLGACNGYQDGDTVVSAGPNAAFVVFRVSNVDATQSTQDFSFNPTLLYVNPPPTYVDDNLSLAKRLGIIPPTVVPHGQVVGINGFAVTTVSTVNPNGAVEANQTSYFFDYKTGASDPSVLLTKQNPKQTTWPLTENCLAISYQ